MTKRHALPTLACGIALLLLTSAYDDNARPAVRGWRRLRQVLASMSHRPTVGAIDPAFPYRPYVFHDEERVRVRSIAAAVARTIPGYTVEDLRVKGIAELLGGNTEEAIRTLSTAGLRRNDARIWTALSAAQLEWADRLRSSDAALDAFTAAKCALGIDPRSDLANFNEFLALQRAIFPRPIPAIKLAFAERRSPWLAEAVRTQSEPPSYSLPWPTEPMPFHAMRSGDEAALRAAIRQHPEMAEELGDLTLGMWSLAYLTNDPKEIMRYLWVARTVASELALRSNDRLLQDVLAAMDPKRYRELAVAHHTLWSGYSAYADTDYAVAEARFRAALVQLKYAQNPWALVVRRQFAAMLLSQFRTDEAIAILEGLRNENLEARHYPLFAAHVAFDRGICAIVKGALPEAVELLDYSRRRFGALRADDEAASADAVLNDVLRLIARPDKAAVRKEPSSAGTPRTDPRVLTAALVAPAIVSMEPGFYHQSFEANLGPDIGADQITERSARLETRVAVAAARAALHGRRLGLQELNAEVNYFLHRAPTFLPSILLARARYERETGDWAAAKQDLLNGLQMIEGSRRAVRDPSHRASMLAAADTLAGELASLALASGDAGEALAISERTRGRAILDSLGGTPLHLADIQRALAPNAAVVTFLPTDGRMRAIVVTRTAATLVDLGDAAKLEQDANGLRDAMAKRNERQATNLTMSLYALVRPLRPALGSATTIAFIPDNTLRGIPFAALYDSKRDRFLVEDFVVTEAPSATIAITTSRHAGVAPTAPVLAIGANDVAVLNSLPAAEREARQVANLRPDSVVLTGGRASPLIFSTLAPRFPILHVAGHGTAGKKAAEATLVFASDDAGGLLSAQDIARLPLQSTRLVVLTACNTAAPGKHGDGPESVASAFLLAGAPTVIATPWLVLDDDAARFAERFHHALLKDQDPAVAFRHACAPRTPDGGPRSPADWAQFSVLGGSQTLVAPTRISMR